jgi:surface antigen/uncharacterized protein YukE
MTQMGMDVEAVENVGRELKQSATSVDQIVGGLDKTVNSLLQIWDGPDAQRLVQNWPAFRKSLVVAQASVAGLGQSALNNASEQRNASGVKGAGDSGGATLPSATHVGDVGQAQTAGSGEAGKPGSSSGALASGDVNAYRQFEQSTSHYNAGVGYNVDANNKGVDNCTAWVDWRREQLGLPTASGDGGQVASNLGGSTSTSPSLGAVVSYYPSDSPNFGHVMIVEQVLGTNPSSLRVSEDNYANAYHDTRIWTQQADGTWQADGRGHSYALTISPGVS